MPDTQGAPILLETTFTPEQLSQRSTVTCYFSAAVSAGDVITVDTADTTYGLGNSFKKTSAVDQGVLGVVTEDVAAGEFGVVVSRGVVDCYLLAGVAAGDGVQSSATAGAGEKALAVTDRRFAMALEATTGSLTSVFVGM